MRMKLMGTEAEILQALSVLRASEQFHETWTGSRYRQRKSRQQFGIWQQAIEVDVISQVQKQYAERVQ